jgi:hypothetical protein
MGRISSFFSLKFWLQMSYSLVGRISSFSQLVVQFRNGEVLAGGGLCTGSPGCRSLRLQPFRLTI